MLSPPPNDADHRRGGDRALVTLVEFGDYECPFSGRAQSIVNDALRRMPHRIQFVFRHFPLAHAHPHALAAAVAAEAAGAQGEFWPMHDALFAHQSALDDEHLLAYADGLGLDTARFTTDLRSDRCRQKVRSDFRSGVRSGVNGTPTFFIDGKRFERNWADGSLTLALATLARKRSPGFAGRAESPKL